MQKEYGSRWVDSKEIIKTNSDFGNAIVDFRVTNNNIKTFSNKTF